MRQTFSYATPRTIDRAEDCYFYHKMNIPGVGDVGETWDLSSSIDNYLGQFEYGGKRVLDVGTASGYLTFEMEKRGAEVVSFDIANGSMLDLVPYVDIQDNMEEVRQRFHNLTERLKNAYWFAHQRVGSKARVYYGDVYDLPGKLGAFDVAVFGMILSHLRDPFQALYSASRLARETIIVTNQMWECADPFGTFIPSLENGESAVWWGPSRALVTRMLSILGFEVQSTTTSETQCIKKGREGVELCVSLVAKRVAGSVCLTGSAKPDRVANEYNTQSASWGWAGLAARWRTVLAGWRSKFKGSKNIANAADSVTRSHAHLT
jgi:SAM-dependent methyltransferase